MAPAGPTPALSALPHQEHPASSEQVQAPGSAPKGFPRAPLGHSDKLCSVPGGGDRAFWTQG